MPNEFNGEKLKIKRRGEDGNKVITVRLQEDIIGELDRLARETNYSRNELINIILRHGVNTIEIVQRAEAEGNEVEAPFTDRGCKCSYVVFIFIAQDDGLVCIGANGLFRLCVS